MINAIVNDLRRKHLKQPTTRPGECAEYHVGPTGNVTFIRLWDDTTDFIRQWDRWEDGDLDIPNPRTAPFVGIVHEDGVVLAPLDVELYHSNPFEGVL